MEDLYKYGQDGTNLRKVQLRTVEILAEVDRICRKHGLRYWIDYGTLLGYRRHNGRFIPWDDDLDVDMPSADFRKFIEIAKTERVIRHRRWVQATYAYVTTTRFSSLIFRISVSPATRVSSSISSSLWSSQGWHISHGDTSCAGVRLPITSSAILHSSISTI